ncbi:MAG TPA: DUF484 family protein [Paenalcaligenes sp.]|nr:DUF484 family protein [Paenalcaligenes sp.]
MTTRHLTATEIADFLVENPSFFQEHASVFAELRVPHPNEKRAISLGERQILSLRARNKELEQQLRKLVGNARSNQKIGEQLHHWSCRMLAEPHAEQLPGHIIRSLTEVFDLDSIALRTWHLIDCGHDDVDDADIQFISSLSKPYCGPCDSQPVLRWLSEPAKSLAIIPLYLQPSGDCVGTLVLASQDEDRFSSDMEVDFLQTIGELSAYALSRLPLTPHLQA